MKSSCSYIPYAQTGYFSKLVLDYISGEEKLQPFYSCKPVAENIGEAIKQKKDFKHRRVLFDELQKQYAGLIVHEKISANIQSLLNENTFTVTTAHQPNIFTGPLYVIYKIFHAIKLAEELSASNKENHFVPVYFMGSEDADLDELNNISLNGRKYVWQTKQTGAVGRMNVDRTLLQQINEIEGQVSVLPHGKELVEVFRASYKENISIQQATLILLNNLFGEYGLVVLIPDNPFLKKLFQPVIEKELKEQFSHKAVEETAKKLEANYKLQAAGREINLFYLFDDKRERIEIKDKRYEVKGLSKEWSLEEILKELDEHPERFSPNVILRGAYQETILPNIVFIGGGGELAYWLELGEVFTQAGVDYPMLLLRNSFLIVDEKTSAKINKLEFSADDFFKDEHGLMKQFVEQHSNNKTRLNGELADAENIYDNLSGAAAKIDATLTGHIAALKKKTLHGFRELEKKLLRAEKKKYAAEEEQVKKIKANLFPGNNLQERVENFSVLYALYGKNFFDSVFLHSTGFQQQFGIISAG